MRKHAYKVYLQFVLYSISCHVHLILTMLNFYIFPLSVKIHQWHLWAELSPNNCLCLASYWSMELCICQSFCSHAFALFVFYWRRRGFLPRGWWGVGVEVLCVVWGEGGVCAFCAACLVILWHHLSTSKPSSGDVLAHLSRLTVWISFWYICTSAVENVSQFILPV